MNIDLRLSRLGLSLPGPLKMPAGARLPFAFVNVRGTRAFISGHGPLAPDGSLAMPLGKVGAEVTPEQGYAAARLTAARRRARHETGWYADTTSRVVA